MPRRRRRTRREDPDDDYSGCIPLIAALTIIPAAVSLVVLGIEAGFKWLGNNWLLVAFGIAVAAVIVGLASRWWRRRRSPRRMRSDIAHLVTLSHYGFEHYCRELFEREGFTAVTTKQTGDRGVDVELRDRDGRLGLAQAKHIMPESAVGRPVIQELYAEMIDRSATFGYVVTTGRFTREAVDWARTKTITLIDGGALLEMADRQHRKV